MLLNHTHAGVADTAPAEALAPFVVALNEQLTVNEHRTVRILKLFCCTVMKVQPMWTLAANTGACYAAIVFTASPLLSSTQNQRRQREVVGSDGSCVVDFVQ